MTREEFYKVMPILSPMQPLEINNQRWENVYQAFKARMLEETTATEIPEGNRVK